MSLGQTVKQDEPIFSFKQQHPDCYYIGVTHSFATDTPTSLSQAPNSALPAFNQDLNHFTPAFILTIDRVFIDPFRTTIDLINSLSARSFKRSWSKSKPSYLTK